MEYVIRVQVIEVEQVGVHQAETVILSIDPACYDCKIGDAISRAQKIISNVRRMKPLA
jgi:hypothetical protein